MVSNDMMHIIDITREKKNSSDVCFVGRFLLLFLFLFIPFVAVGIDNGAN